MRVILGGYEFGADRVERHGHAWGSIDRRLNRKIVIKLIRQAGAGTSRDADLVVQL